MKIYGLTDRPSCTYEPYKPNTLEEAIKKVKEISAGFCKELKYAPAVASSYRKKWWTHKILKSFRRSTISEKCKFEGLPLPNFFCTR